MAHKGEQGAITLRIVGESIWTRTWICLSWNWVSYPLFLDVGRLGQRERYLSGRGGWSGTRPIQGVSVCWDGPGDVLRELRRRRRQPLCSGAGERVRAGTNRAERGNTVGRGRIGHAQKERRAGYGVGQQSGRVWSQNPRAKPDERVTRFEEALG